MTATLARIYSVMLTLRRYQPPDQEAVWELHTVALVQTGAYISSGAWDDDLHRMGRKSASSAD